MNYTSPTLRRPSDRAQLYAWHANALAQLKAEGVDTLKELAARNADAVQVHEDDPQCGWFKVRLTKGGVLVAARVFVHQLVDQDGALVDQERLVCQLGADFVDPLDAWTLILNRPIPRSEYQYQAELFAWSTRYQPGAPQARPHQAVDFSTAPIPTWPKRKRQ